MSPREYDATVAAALAHLAGQQNASALPLALVAGVQVKPGTEGKRRPSLARRAYEELHTLIAEAVCRLGERSMRRAS